MKTLIWMSCLFLYVLATTLITRGGFILGAIPTIALFCAASWLAKHLCKKWDEKKSGTDTQDNNVAEKQPVDVLAPVEEDSAEGIQEPKEAENASPIEEVPAPVLEHKSAPKKNAKKTTVLLSCALAISLLALAGSVVYILRQSAELEELKNHDELLSKNYDILFKKYDNETRILNYTISELETQVRKMESKLDFYNDSVVFVLDDGTNIYHRYMCPHWPTGRYSYWAYNPEAAASRGYYKCSYYDSGLVKN